MREVVSDILDMRAREVEGLSRMVTVSLVAHAALLSILIFAPASWLSSPAPVDTTPPMFISIGGSPGPDAGGMTQQAGRPVQAIAPPEPRRVEAPPAAKAPEMTLPDPAAKPRPTTKPVDKPLDKSATRKPTTGPEVKSGDARANIPGQAIPFGGLSTSSGGGTGGVTVLGDFCCPDYIVMMNQRIRQNWDKAQGAAGENVIKFVIRRDGMLANVEVEKSSGNPVLDLASRRAVLNTQQLPPLPPEFTPPNLTILLTFEYKR